MAITGGAGEAKSGVGRTVAAETSSRFFLFVLQAPRAQEEDDGFSMRMNRSLRRHHRGCPTTLRLASYRGTRTFDGPTPRHLGSHFANRSTAKIALVQVVGKPRATRRSGNKNSRGRRPADAKWSSGSLPARGILPRPSSDAHTSFR